jgi:CO/xanthine dehydrogenase Mo-binding subunit
LAAEKAREQIIARAAQVLNTTIDSVSLKSGQVWNGEEQTSLTVKEMLAQCRGEGVLTLGHGYFNPATTKLDPETGHGKPFATYAFATQVAEVIVDTETGVVEVTKIVAAHDVGRAINPQSVEGQIEGGCAMGLGYALVEEVIVKDGVIKNPEMSTYLVPTSMDVPEIYPIIIEELEASGPYGAKGVGEPALVPTAAAIANAVSDALGVRIYDLPMTPERVVDAIKSAQK